MSVQTRIYNYFERNPQLHVLFIFDRMDIIASELRECTWDDARYVYRVFDGTWFNTKYAIENDWKEKRVVLLFPESTYPVTEKDMLMFPLLDVLRANMEYKEEDYASFMQQYNLPQKFAPFIKRHTREITSAKMMNMLNGYLTAEAFSEDVVCRAFLSLYMGEKKVQDWYDLIVRLIVFDHTADEKKRTDFAVRLNQNLDATKALQAKLNAIFGMGFQPNVEKKFKAVTECLKYNTITQQLEVSAADNYKQYKITNAIQLDQINKIFETGIHDRVLGGKFSEAVRALGADIKEGAIIECYGIDANYFYMTEKLCWPILKSILESRLIADPDSVNEKMREFGPKFADGSDILLAIRFIGLVALYYDKVRNIGTLKLNSPELYVKRYTEEFYLIDMFYRHSLEKYHELMKKDIPIEQSISKAKRDLDKDYAKVTNVLNLEWLTCVGERKDYFDSLSLPKQEDFFDNELDADTKKVVIVCDALRYEVAAELMQQLSKEKHIARLTAMRTMLPTETKFCKPALLPHQSLSLQGSDMWVDGNLLSTTEQRTSHVDKYREGALCVNYEDVMSGVSHSVRDLFKRPLVYIFYNTIDETAHSQSPFEVIRACHTAVEQLAVLIRRLHATWNVTNVYLTSDHGFIYNDMQFEEKDKHSITEECIEKKTRYYLTNSSKAVEGIMKFPLDKVSSMTVPADTYVAVPIGTNRLAAPGGYSFAHGGATLQEMIIPLIVSYRKKVDKTEKVGVSLMSHNLTMVSSRLKFQLIQTEAVSMTMQERRIACQLFCGEEPVSMEKEIVLNSPDSTNLNNRLYELSLNLNKSVSSSMLQLRIVDVDDRLNPLIKETVRNNTIIEQDF